jgi:hypothetical protein
MRPNGRPPNTPPAIASKDFFGKRQAILKPIWVKVRRELWLDGVLVKRFRQPAKNQETILAVFQEEGWPDHIDDPLTGGDGVDGQDRLHDAIRRLNQQRVSLILFASDGLGKGVLWQLRKNQRPRSAQRAPKKRPRSAP